MRPNWKDGMTMLDWTRAEIERRRKVWPSDAGERCDELLARIALMEKVAEAGRKMLRNIERPVTIISGDNTSPYERMKEAVMPIEAALAALEQTEEKK